MVQIAYLLLCHRDPEALAERIGQLTAAGDCVAVHFDARAARTDYRRLRRLVESNANVAFTPRRLRCGWGEWSLVQATLEAARTALAAFPSATHAYLISGDCLPIKTAEFMHGYLSRARGDFIEAVDFHNGGWIRTGLKDERLAYRHFFNERRHKALFYTSLAIQQRLRLRRQVPDDLRVMIGSQWWCLRRETLARVLAFCDGRPDVCRFFRTTWIPDETFFQTLVRHLVPGEEIESRPPTFLMFTDYGLPVTFHDDHHDLLLEQDALFARKVSPEARNLRAKLGRLYGERGRRFAICPTGRARFRFESGAGRTGRRFAPRAWEGAGDSERELLLVVCKKWHVAARLLERLRPLVGGAAHGFVFDEEAAGLPALGGLERGLEKRRRHRRAFVELLFAAHGTRRLALCLDPSRLDALRDLAAGSARARVLEIDCALDQGWLAGHARRLGLAGAAGLDAILPALRNDLAAETARLRAVGFARHERLRQSATADENALPLSRFLSIPKETARQILSGGDLFAD